MCAHMLEHVSTAGMISVSWADSEPHFSLRPGQACVGKKGLCTDDFSSSGGQLTCPLPETEPWDTRRAECWRVAISRDGCTGCGHTSGAARQPGQEGGTVRSGQTESKLRGEHLGLSLSAFCRQSASPAPPRRKYCRALFSLHLVLLFLYMHVERCSMFFTCLHNTPPQITLQCHCQEQVAKPACAHTVAKQGSLMRSCCCVCCSSAAAHHGVSHREFQDLLVKDAWLI